MAVTERQERVTWRQPLTRRRSWNWVARYQRHMVLLDVACGLLAGLLALVGRFPGPNQPFLYVITTLGLPVVWVTWVAILGGYDQRFIGLGSEEFRRLINATISLTAAVAIVSYALKLEFARGYVLIALPGLGAVDTAARFMMRKRLHRNRARGRYMRRVTAVGHPAAVAALIEQLRRDRFHGLEVVNACLVDHEGKSEIGGVPVAGGLRDAARVAGETGADTVAVLACPEMDGLALRRLAWELEKEGTDLCVAPALMDVAGPRTTIRSVAGLPLLHVDHAELSGAKRALKSFFDVAAATAALCVFSPVLVFIALAIILKDGGPALFTQTRIGKDGLPFTVLKFRTMVPDAELRKNELLALDEGDGLLFKVRKDPRVTATGFWLRRWSLDEFPQLFNVILGEMSLVGPRPPLPSEAARYGDDVRRRLVVKPGMTGLWQVNGRSDLSRDDAVRLDLRYVENWSLVLDLQILWKTCAAVTRGRGAYLPAGRAAWPADIATDFLGCSPLGDCGGSSSWIFLD
jgi:exopolysaccharide biosynthesis polyprenyl glycosylphosphotransferase